MATIVGTELDESIHLLAAVQHGVFSTHQALGLGANPQQLHHRITQGSFRRVAPHVLCVAGIPLTSDVLMHAALLEVGGRSAVGLSSAAALWRLPGFKLEPFQLLRLRDGTFDPATLGTVHTTRRLPDTHVAEVDGMLVTTPTRTLFDLARTLHPDALENLIDRAWSMRLTSGALLDRTLKELSGKGQTGISTMRELLATRGPDYVPPDSNLEGRFQKLAGQRGYGGFRRQVHLGDDIGIIGRVDFFHDARKVVVEIDSALHHTSISDRRRDAERRRRLESAGWTVIQVTEFELWHQPQQMLDRIGRALSHR